MGYHTVTHLFSIEALGDNRLRARVDFTGDFGHEIGRLDIVFNEKVVVLQIDADLEKADVVLSFRLVLIRWNGNDRPPPLCCILAHLEQGSNRRTGDRKKQRGYY